MDLSRLRERFVEYRTVVEPDRDTAEWWAGAPSVCRDDAGTFWMACRMREGDSPRGRRGYEIRLLRSDDGERFEPVHGIRREDVPIPGFERPALLFDPVTGRFSLYACGPYDDGPWCVLRFDDAASPTEFVASTAQPVIAPEAPTANSRFNVVVGYKDPFILRGPDGLHCFAIGYDRAERTYHFRSLDGSSWEQVGGGPALDLGGWHT
ncbi:MAG TPA: hypothetical protein PLD23_13920, partial [Armatimonadota bacterium]|nr:hypothetical protein [Armatimonadota bacterium]